jgi:hypothetical protein
MFRDVAIACWPSSVPVNLMSSEAHSALAETDVAPLSWYCAFANES